MKTSARRTCFLLLSFVLLLSCCPLTALANSVSGKKGSVFPLSIRENPLSCGKEHSVVLHADGTVSAVGNNDKGQCDVASWRNVRAVYAGEFGTMGVLENGDVVAAGRNDYGQREVDDWHDIVQLVVGTYHTVGLRSDGTVVAVGWNGNGQCDVEDWTDIVAIAGYEAHTVGLRSDGTVVAVGANYYGENDVEDWTNVKDIVAGRRHTVGLLNDGTVVATGSNDKGQLKVDGWKKVSQITSRGEQTMALLEDGTAVACGDNQSGQCNVGILKNVVWLASGTKYYLALRSDGSFVARGDGEKGQCNVNRWKNIAMPGETISSTASKSGSTPKPTATPRPASTKSSGKWGVQDAYTLYFPSVSGCYHIPELTLDTTAAKKTNEAIYSKWTAYLERWHVEEAEGSSGLSYLHYMVGTHGNVATILMHSLIYGENCEFGVHFLSKKDGSEISAGALLKAFGLTETKTREQLRSFINEYFEDYKAEALAGDWDWGEEWEDMWQDSLSESNLKAAFPFINEDGSLCYAVRLLVPVASGELYLLKEYKTGRDIILPDCRLH